MTKPHLEHHAEPFFITQDVVAELTATGYEFEPPVQARTASIRELFGWKADEALSEAVTGHLVKAGTGSGRESRGESV